VDDRNAIRADDDTRDEVADQSRLTHANGKDSTDKGSDGGNNQVADERQGDAVPS
jgi:hypothetical protein